MSPTKREKSESPLRLQVYLARSGVASRRKAESWILAGAVRVNGKVVQTLGSKVDIRSDEVTVNGRRVSFEAHQLFLFNKPQGVITTLKDTHGRPCLGDYLKDFEERLFPVGRLDSDVSGLLLLTNHGEFADKLLHPRNEVPRVYQARVVGQVTKDTIDALKSGVTIDGEKKRASAGILRSSPRAAKTLGGLRQGESYIELTVREGSKHFVKKLLTGVSHPVVRLARVRFGPYELGDLAIGQIRPAQFPREFD